MESLGPYDLLSPIGQGGMAEVWLARRSMAGGPGKLVAIKRMAAGLSSQAHYRDMFEAETRMSMTLSHSNIVQVFDFGSELGNAYIVMELVDGVDLGSLLSWSRDHGQPLPYRLSSFVIGELLRALDYSHNLTQANASMGLIHRDVSPQNLLISKAGEVKLTDFGVARLVDENTSGAQPKGKLRYMAPEQLNGQGMDARVDLYAVGAIFYEMLVGAPYRDADTVEQLYGQILNPGPVQMPAATPQVLAELTVDLLALEPQHRVATAAVALSRLRMWPEHRDARDDLAEVVKRCRPEELVVPPPLARSSDNARPSGSTALHSDSIYEQRGFTEAMPPPTAGGHAQTQPQTVPEHTTMPDSPAIETSPHLQPPRRGPGVGVLLTLGLIGAFGAAATVWLSPSLRDMVLGEPGDGTAVASQASTAPVAGASAKGRSALARDGVAAEPAQMGRVTPSSASIAPRDRLEPATLAQDPPGQTGPVPPAETPGDKGPTAATPAPSKPTTKPTTKPTRTGSRRKDRTTSSRGSGRTWPRPNTRVKTPRPPATKPIPKTKAPKVTVQFKAGELGYAYVKMAGRKILIEPVGAMKVPPGKYTVMVREASSDPWRSFGVVDVQAKQSMVIRLRRSGSFQVSRRAL